MSMAAHIANGIKSEILGRIRAPIFPANEFVITRFGAVGDGKSDCTTAIAKQSRLVTKLEGESMFLKESFLRRNSFAKQRRTHLARALL